MIGRLRGQICEKASDHLILDVMGVGYLVSVSNRTLQALPVTDDAIVLHIETHVREDAIRLFGFMQEEERAWFRLLLTVQGVGTRSALGLLSALSNADLMAAISSQDKSMIARAPGIGPKLAARIVSELQGKVLGAFLSQREETPTKSAAALVTQVSPTLEEAISGLVNLGYARAQAFVVVEANARALTAQGSEPSTAQLIRLSLKQLTAS